MVSATSRPDDGDAMSVVSSLFSETPTQLASPSPTIRPPRPSVTVPSQTRTGFEASSLFAPLDSLPTSQSKTDAGAIFEDFKAEPVPNDDDDDVNITETPFTGPEQSASTIDLGHRDDHVSATTFYPDDVDTECNAARAGASVSIVESPLSSPANRSPEQRGYTMAELTWGGEDSDEAMDERPSGSDVEREWVATDGAWQSPYKHR